MKKSHLRKIIKEEISKVLKEDVTWTIDRFNDSPDLIDAPKDFMPKVKELVPQIMVKEEGRSMDQIIADFNPNIYKKAIPVVMDMVYDQARENAKGGYPEDLKFTAYGFAENVVEVYYEIEDEM